MNAAQTKLKNRIAGMNDGSILECLTAMNKTITAYSPEERIVRAYMLNEWESRHGAESVDAVMDKLDELVAA